MKSLYVIEDMDDEVLIKIKNEDLIKLINSNM